MNEESNEPIAMIITENHIAIKKQSLILEVLNFRKSRSRSVETRAQGEYLMGVRDWGRSIKPGVTFKLVSKDHNQKEYKIHVLSRP